MAKIEFELVFIDKEGKWHPLDEVDSEELAQGLKMPVFVPKRLNVEFVFPAYHLILGNPVSNTSNICPTNGHRILLPFLKF